MRRLQEEMDSQARDEREAAEKQLAQEDTFVEENT